MTVPADVLARISREAASAIASSRGRAISRVSLRPPIAIYELRGTDAADPLEWFAGPTSFLVAVDDEGRAAGEFYVAATGEGWELGSVAEGGHYQYDIMEAAVDRGCQDLTGKVEVRVFFEGNLRGVYASNSDGASSLVAYARMGGGMREAHGLTSAAVDPSRSFEIGKVYSGQQAVRMLRQWPRSQSQGLR